jgi:hypothetical protein
MHTISTFKDDLFSVNPNNTTPPCLSFFGASMESINPLYLCLSAVCKHYSWGVYLSRKRPVVGLAPAAAAPTKAPLDSQGPSLVLYEY